MQHPLPTLYQTHIQRLGDFRTLDQGLLYDFESSLFRGSNRAMVRFSLTFHPREAEYGGTVSFAGDEMEQLREEVAPLARGMWEALAEFRLINFALVVEGVELVTSGQSAPLLAELGERAIRHALNEAQFTTHKVAGWVKPAPPDPEGELPPSGAERRAARESRRKQQKSRSQETPRRPARGGNNRSRRPKTDD